MSVDNYHLTLKFLGSVDEARLAEIAAAIGGAVTAVEPFDIAVRGLGAFPTVDRARVLWAGVSAGASPLAALADAVEGRLAALGFAREARAFSAHVTLGRVREARRNPTLAEALTRAAHVELGSARVDHVRLMQSRLSPQGARYEERAELPLVGRGR